ncbi:MAG: GH116 family glycosyl hydrolase [Candidatus Aminicenantales bacterium]
MKNQKTFLRIISVAGLYLATSALPGRPANPVARAASRAEGSAGPEAAGIQKTLRDRYLALLMEKGICDDAGREIDGRLGRMIDEAGKAGRKSDQDVLKFVLAGLNFTPSNLAGFPACAFDRPIGYTLQGFGHTIADGNIDATAMGSACPVGGIGAGGFERLMSGNFETWFLKSGWMVEDTVWADQFHVYMKSGGRTIAQTLSTDAPPSEAGLGSWAWRYPAGKGDYYALFPKSGFSYEKNGEWPVKLAVVQFSPVIPGNYRETSFPVAVYRWIAENPQDRPAELSLLLTWQNMVGWEAVQAGSASETLFKWARNGPGLTNEFIEAGPTKAVVFRNKNTDLKKGNAMSGTMAIAALEIPGKTKVHFLTDFDPKGDGAALWTTFREDGTLADSRTSRVASREDATAAALAVKVTLKPKERIEIPFVVAWDFPFYEFEPGVKIRKKYTEFFGATGENAFAIAAAGLSRYMDWEKAIDNWHRTITGDPKLPDWFRQALLNELYVLPETSIWDAETNLHTYLESADYLMYGTFDVDSYCWHVLKLWPELEFNNMRFFAGTVPIRDSSYRAYQYNELFPGEVPADKKSYYWNTIKVPGMVPHDIGSPRRRPWVVLNAFDWQNGNVWKDLNPKFPLRAFRDFQASGGRDMEFLKTMFTASVVALDTLEKRFGDPRSHIPLNEGIPDQTYDTWRMKGESAYVGMLWLAALKTTAAMADILLEHEIVKLDGLEVRAAADRYRGWMQTGGRSLETLWDERDGYYHIDAHTDDIMTDQLFGVWYSAMLGLEGGERDSIIPEGRVQRTLRTIYENNVLGYGGGLMGAVNGRTAAGRQLRSQQGDEVWVGTAYAFAADCLLHGLDKEGMHTAYGLYHVVWSPFGQGYFFKTPEAYLNPQEKFWNDPGRTYGDRLFRAMKYMRPGAVWAVYEALLKKRP